MELFLYGVAAGLGIVVLGAIALYLVWVLTFGFGKGWWM